MKPPKSPTDKLLAQLAIQERRSQGAFTFKQHKTIRDFLTSLGVDSTDESPLSKAYITEYYNKRRAEIAAGVKVDAIHVVTPKAVEPEESLELPPLPVFSRPGVKFMKKQNEAATHLLKGIHAGKRGQLLLCPTGGGKTYIYGAVLATLLQEGWFEKQRMSPYPNLIITRATIVAQTQEVIHKLFGIPVSMCTVTNIDQLRSDFGEQFVKTETIVQHGQEHIVFRWHPVMAPNIVVWDECQGLKNEQSTQSQIGASANNLPDETGLYQIFSSATPFMRVCEAKCFAVATRLEFI